MTPADKTVETGRAARARVRRLYRRNSNSRTKVLETGKPSSFRCPLVHLSVHEPARDLSGLHESVLTSSRGHCRHHLGELETSGDDGGCRGAWLQSMLSRSGLSVSDDGLGQVEL